MNKVHHQQSYKKIQGEDLSTRLRPGRHLCDCQSRVHKLVRNCLNCGRIVCEQEGSGPCLYCGTLVCTREERKILDEGSKRSQELLSQLLKGSDEHIGMATAPHGSSSSLALLGQSIQTANAYKEKLLAADKDQEITKVHDLEADYFTLECDPYLTSEEREAIVRRKEELRDLSQKAKKTFLFDLDFENKSVQERERDPIETVNDPVLQSILVNSAARTKTKESAKKHFTQEELFAKNFVPKYDPTLSSAPIRPEEMTKEILAKEAPGSIRRARNTVYCIALKQPFASNLTNTEDGISCVPWKRQVDYRGPILIAALDDSQTIDQFHQAEEFREYFVSSAISISEYPKRAIIGKATLKECLTYQQYNQEFSEKPFFRPLKQNSVLVFDAQEPLPQPVPYDCPTEFFELDRKITESINRTLFTNSLFDEFDINLA